MTLIRVSNLCNDDDVDDDDDDQDKQDDNQVEECNELRLMSFK